MSIVLKPFVNDENSKYDSVVFGAANDTIDCGVTDGMKWYYADDYHDERGTTCITVYLFLQSHACIKYIQPQLYRYHNTSALRYLVSNVVIHYDIRVYEIK